MTTSRVRLYAIASILFLLSGCTGLIYEVVWFKRFTHVWGSSTLAMASVVGSFLLGLGLGAHLLGRVADRVARPLAGYGLCEIGIGALAIVIPIEILGLMRVTAPVHLWFHDHLLLQYLVRFGLTLVVLGPPCVLMGGTLPLLVKQFTPAGTQPREATGWLYAVNTLGAAAGCYLAGFHLLPSIGLQWSNLSAAVVNLAIGLVALAAARLLAGGRHDEIAATSPAEATGPAVAGPAHAGPPHAGPPLAPHGPSPAEPTPSPGYGSSALYTAVALTGLAALILQMAWARQLALILGGSTYAFSAMLFVILVGIGLGSLAFRLWSSRFSSLSVILAVLVAVVLAGTLLGQRLVVPLTYLVGALRGFRSSLLVNGLVCVTASLALELLPAMGMGFLFPLFVHMTRRLARDAGTAVGNVYACNTAGTIVGATITFSLLIPRWGTSVTVTFALGLFLAAILSVFPYRNRRDNIARITLFVLACPVLLWTVAAPDPRITNRGVYLYGYEPGRRLEAEVNLLSYREGSTTSVLVTEQQGAVYLRVGGKTDASSGRDMPTQIGLACLPRFVLPEARKVLVIGYGSGVTAGVSLLFPDTAVRCCEIERAVFEASKFFKDANHQPDQSPHFSLVLEDGRNYLQAMNEQFDLIISEPSNPWMAGVSNLFTREFYETVKRRLGPGGILGQWVQLYGFSPAEYALIARTVMSVFPHCRLMSLGLGDTLLLASESSLEVSRQTVETAQALVDRLPALRSDLERHFRTTDVASVLLSRSLLDEEGLRRMIAGQGAGPINTDLNMRLEFAAPRHMFKLEQVDPALSQAILGSTTDPQWLIDLFARWGGSKKQLGALRQLATMYAEHGLDAVARGLVDFALQIDPEDVFLLGEKLRLSPTDNPEVLADASRLAARDAREAMRTGALLFQKARYAQAATVFEAILRVRGASATVWNGLAATYEALGQWDKADQAFRQALTLDPADSSAVNSYAAFMMRRAATAPAPTP